MHLAIVIPVYNEARWVRSSVERLASTPAPITAQGQPCSRTIILVNDGSTDGTTDIINALASEGRAIAIHHSVNSGKGAALRTGFAKALELAADIILVHDADLEYDPRDHAAALAPILDGRADAVIGSRFIGQTHRVLYYWHYVANKLISTFCGMVTNLNLSDAECCTKAFTAQALRAMPLTANKFDIEIEMIARIARARFPSEPEASARVPSSPEASARVPSSPTTRRARIYEVAVSYSGRTYEEGKKIGWQDGLEALWAILKHGLG